MKYFSVPTFRIQPKSHLPPLKVSSELTEAKLQLTCAGVCVPECVCLCVFALQLRCPFFVANLPKVRTHRQSQRTLTPPTRLTALSALKAIRQLEAPDPGPAPAQGALGVHPVVVAVAADIVGFVLLLLLPLALSII